jgi:fluoride exporter
MSTLGAAIAVALGAVLGAWMRWGLSLWLNERTPQVPMGTLLANLIGGYAVGVAIALFSDRTGISPEWRLFIVTGFLGGLTTFSTFSAESVTLMLRGEYGWAITHIVSHLAGSLVMTALGIATYRLLRG